MDQFNIAHDVKLEAKYHYKKEIFECNLHEVEKNKNEWLENFNSNFRVFPKHKHIDHLFRDKNWQNLECVVVGAGPTLDEDMENIKRYRHNFKLICIDSVLYPLLKQNIKPDFVFTKNVDGYVIDLFKDCKLKDIKIVANLFQKPELIRKVKSDFFFYLPYDDIPFLENFINFYPQIPKLMQKQSTMVMAFLLARCMNFRTIYLLGADFCFDDKNKIYCDNILYDKELLKPENIVEPENIFLDKTSTTMNLYNSSEDFFRIIAVESLDKVLNCSRNSILYNLNWVYFDEIMKRFNTTKRNVFEFASVEHDTNDETVNKMNEVTTNYFRAISARSVFKNIERASKEKNLSELHQRKEEFSQKNCIICGAGPSLAENLELLKKNREKFVVFGVDASLLPLYRAGIDPDYILSIDPCDLSLFFKDYDGTRAGLIASIHTHFQAIKTWKNHIYFYYPVPIKRFDYWLLSLIEGYSKIQFLEPLSNCGSTVLYLAIKLCFKNVAIVGMDFSYTGNKMYTPDTVAESIIGFEKIDNEEKLKNNLQKYNLIKTVNCKNEEVYTDGTYLTYARSLEGILKIGNVNNVTNVGVSILKIPHMPFEEYLNKVINN